MDVLVVEGSHIDDLTGNLRGHVCDLHANHTVARPWRCHIQEPAISCGDKRCYDEHTGRKISEQADRCSLFYR
jgi:hypothetical protein